MQNMNPRCPPLNDATVRSMKGNKRKDTGPELLLREALRNAGFPGYRLQWNVPGHPDICYPGRRIAIFVNGCFWHRCPRCNLPAPRHNNEYWMQKLEGNVARDSRKISELDRMGWRVVVVWECEIDNEPGVVIDRLKTLLSGFDHKV